MNKWIKVNDRLPDIGVWAVGKHGSHRPFTCRWVEEGSTFRRVACLDPDNNYRDPTIWTPIPEPPEETK